MKKRILSCFLAVCMIISLLPVQVIAEELTTKSGTCGENVTWTLFDGALTISGTGDMKNYNYWEDGEPAPWHDDAKTVKTVVVESGVTGIGAHALEDCSMLTSVAIPNGVTSIGEYAFGGCKSLESISLPDSVTSIGGAAFYRCGNLTSVNIPNGVTVIEGSVFYGCSSLTNLIIPDGVTSIGYCAFCECSSLQSITIPDSVTSIGEYAFSGCYSLTDVNYSGTAEQWNAITIGECNDRLTFCVIHCADSDVYPHGSCGENVMWTLKNNTLIISGEGAMEDYHVYDWPDAATPWSGKYITSVVIESGVTKIGDFSFCNCSDLTSVTIADSVTSIGDYTFYGCSELTNVTIPGSVKSIGKLAFAGCSGLTSVVLSNGVKSIESNAFAECSSLTSITIPDSVTSIGDRAFFACTDLISAKLPDGITKIGDSLFDNCTSLERVNIPDSVTSIGAEAFFYTALYNNSANWDNGLLYIDRCLIAAKNTVKQCDIKADTRLIAVDAFANCEALENVAIPESVKYIGDSAFRACSSLKSITIPNSVTSIQYRSFEGCSSLKSITIPTAVTQICDSAFRGCVGLADVFYLGTAEQWSKVTIEAENYRLTGCVIHCTDDDVTTIPSCGENVTWKLENGTLTISGTGKMDDYGESGNGLSSPWDDYSDNITSVIVESGVTSIGSDAFEYCSKLTSVTLPDSVTSIGHSAFEYCSGLTGITIPNGVTSIGDYAFSGCSSLKSVTLPNNMTSIGEGVFSYCNDLTGMTIPDNVTSIGYDAFTYCSSLTSITIPVSVTEIDAYVFQGCSGLADVYYSGATKQWAEVAIGEGNTYLTNCVIHCTDGDIEHIEYCGDNAICTLKNGTLTIFGTGETYDYGLDDTPWRDITSVVIESGITGIGDHMFAYCNNLTSVTISDSVTSIGYSAFEGCSNLTSITIPDSVTSIYDYAFSGCTNLTDVNYSGTIEQWREVAIGEGNKNLTNLAIHCTDGDIEHIEYCGEKATWTLADGVLTISGTGAMYDYERDSAPWHDDAGEITSVVVGSGVTSIGNYAFSGCGKLTSVAIPDSVTSIGEYAFSSCTGLDSITIPDGVTSIGGSAFSGCSSLTSITIPDSVTSIGNDAFSDCTGLTEIIVGEHNGAYCSVNGVLFDKSKTKILSYPAGKETEEYVIPDSVTSIGILAFYGCSSLTSITIPDSVTDIGNGAFYGCSGLASITIPNSVTSIGILAFAECSSLTSITIPDSVTDIGDGAFSGCSSLTSVTIGNGVTSIGILAFAECSGLTSIRIPDSVTSIGDYAFDACYDLTDVNYSGTIRQWADIVIGEGNTYLTDCDIHCTDGDILAGEYCGKHAKWTLVDGVLTISGKGRMYDYETPMLEKTDNQPPWSDKASSITKIVISDKITYIGSYAFSGCSNLTELTIPSGVTGIGDSIVAGCSSLASISVDENNEHFVVLDGVLFDKEMTTLYYFPPAKTGSYVIPDGVKTIAGYAFSFSSLADVTVPGSVTEIRTAAFAASEVLTDIKFEQGDPQRAMSIGFGAFMSCGLTGIALPDGVTSIGDYAFYGCVNMKNAALPDSVTSIGENAFVYCKKLTGINIPRGVTTIGKTAFVGCYALEKIVVDENNEYYSSQGGVLFDKNMSTLILCPAGKTGSYDIPDGVTSINANAFSYSKLLGVSIPYGVTEIGEDMFVNSQLSIISIPESVTVIKDAFSYSNLSGVLYGGTKEQWNSISISDPKNKVANATIRYGMAPKLSVCGDALSWTLEDGVLTISGTGDMYDFDLDGHFAPWLYEQKTITSVVIADGVTGIGDYAFAGQEGITDISIPDSVTRIGESAFYYCLSLTSVTIPDSVTSIGYYAFYECSGLTSIRIPDSVTSIGDFAFSDCSSLTSVMIPDSVTSIGESAFYGCSSIKDVYYTGDVSSWQGISFSDSDSNPCYHGANLYFGGELATDVVIPEGVTSIGNYAFYGCSSLTSVTIPDSVTNIGNYAFCDCSSIMDVYYSASLEKWGKMTIGSSNDPLINAKLHCTDGSFICYGKCADNLIWALDDSGTLTISGTGAMNDYSWSENNDGVNVTTAPWGKYYKQIKSIVIEDGVTSVGNGVLYGCSSLTSITMPDSVTSIGGHAFEDCSSIKDVYYTGDVSSWLGISFGNYYSNPCWSGANLYFNGELVTDVVIPNSVTSISDYAFRGCSGLTSVTIGNGVTCIGDWAFSGCSSLTSMTIPDSVTSIGNDAFGDCSSLTSVTIGNGVTSIGNYAFYNCNSLTSITIPDSVTSIGWGAFRGCSSLTSITIPDSVTSIGDDAFEDCSSLIAIDVDENNETYCSDNGVLFNKDKTSLIAYPAAREAGEYQIPDGVTSIGNSAFEYCSSLTCVTIPDGVTSIGSYVFSYCSSLTSVTIPDSVTSIGWGAFRGCSSLTSITIPDGVTSLGYDAFRYCSSLTSIKIPDSVTSISEEAFYNCTSLEKVYYGGTAEQWEKITISSGNDVLDNAEIIFMSTHTHSYTDTVVEPTCTEKGYTTHTCECGDSYVDSYVDALGHDLVHHDGKAATCTTDGWEAYDTCTRCSYTTYKKIAATGHHYTDVVTEPNCTQAGYTTHTCDCGYSYKDSYVAALGHDYGEWAQTKEPNCTEKGSETRSCARCNAVETRSIAATGHHYTDVVTEPNCTQAGYTTHTCDCGHSYTDSYVDALGHSYENGKCTRCGAVDPSTVEINAGKLTVSGESGRYGDEVTVSVSISDNPGFNSMKLALSYDKSKLQLIGCEDAGLKGWNVSDDLTWSGSDDTNYNGVIVKLKFKILEGCDIGDTQIAVSYSSGDIRNKATERICPEVINGKVTVWCPVAGDLNGDDIVNALDLLILKKYLGDNNIQLAGNGDFNGDGVIDELDLTMLKQFLAGDDVQLH